MFEDGVGVGGGRGYGVYWFGWGVWFSWFFVYIFVCMYEN